MADYYLIIDKEEYWFESRTKVNDNPYKIPQIYSGSSKLPDDHNQEHSINEDDKRKVIEKLNEYIKYRARKNDDYRNKGIELTDPYFEQGDSFYYKGYNESVPIYTI
ncbi:hypothetical protein [Silvanigrella aquatica]|uniref:Uncharacterized protein n=1 Tax=Silvanigrella aquatica TaxID=1915309 RepID=A0A1L4CYK6_9BACT|nr:hypothetical protein [Silvanigrella aquatica]APJ03043.1 hypothetical protein AXG55_03605 [Silvanigrella aquatica]